MRLSEDMHNELTAYANELASVEGAESLLCIADNCNSTEEIDSVYYCLTLVMNQYKDAYIYAVSTTTKKSKHEQQLKFTEYMETLSPQDKEGELYSLYPLVSNGSYIQLIKDRFRAEVEQVLTDAGIGKKRRTKITTDIIKELTTY